MRVITRKGSNRVAREAFEIARTRKRKKVTAAHKEPVYRLACGMFAEECRKVAREYPDVAFEEMMIDSISMKLVTAPQQFDVVVTTNQFGDILTDIGAGLVGGLGLAPGLCVGERQAMAQATHGSAPDITGRNIANPYAMIVSGQMLLAWLGRKRSEPKATAAAGRIHAAVDKVIAAGKRLTRDLGGRPAPRKWETRSPPPCKDRGSTSHAGITGGRFIGRTYMRIDLAKASRHARARRHVTAGDAGASGRSDIHPALRADLAAASHSNDLSIPRGRGHRFHCAPGRQAPVGPARPAGLCREPRRRQRRNRPAGPDASRP